MSPTARTLKAYRDRGCLAQVVERYNRFARRRIDLFGFIDGVTMDPVSRVIIGWQATSGSNLQSRIAKIKGPCRSQALLWLRCGGRIDVWGWRKLLVKRGGKRARWEPAVVELGISDLSP